MTVTSDPPRVGFIGSGRMATALARGLISAGFTTADCVIGADVVPAARERFAAESGARTADSNGEVLQNAEVVFLAVKPQHVSQALGEIRNHVTPAHLLVSIAAGVPIRTLTAALGESARIVRVMPNTPCLIGAGASAFSPGGGTTEEDARLIERALSTAGIAVRVPESLLDAVTGLSGSGPAYVYQIVEALADGGVRAGLPRDVALKLAAQTVQGAARMVLETGEHPAALKDAVASPGGTTIAGLHALERAGLRGALMDAVQAAAARSRELGRSS